MSMMIPKGKEYIFTITVLEKNSYLPKDLEAMDMANSSFVLIKNDDLTQVSGAIIERTPDDITAQVLTYRNGLLSVTLPADLTAGLSYERGGKVDGFYLKPVYFGAVEIKFTDGTDNIVAEINNVRVIPLGQ